MVEHRAPTVRRKGICFDSSSSLLMEDDMKWNHSEKTDTSGARSKRKSVPVRLRSVARCLRWRCFLGGSRIYQPSESVQGILSFHFSMKRWDENQICHVLERRSSDSSLNFGRISCTDHAIAVPAFPDQFFAKLNPIVVRLRAIGAP